MPIFKQDVGLAKPAVGAELTDYHAFDNDPVLKAIVHVFDAEWARERLHAAGKCEPESVPACLLN